jgi:hypothetical protein
LAAVDTPKTIRAASWTAELSAPISTWASAIFHQQYAHLVPHGFFTGQLDLASAVLPNPRC